VYKFEFYQPIFSEIVLRSLLHVGDVFQHLGMIQSICFARRAGGGSGAAVNVTTPPLHCNSLTGGRLVGRDLFYLKKQITFEMVATLLRTRLEL
jgi:hypothetical protein